MDNENLRPWTDYGIEDDIKDFHLDGSFESSGLNFVALDVETATFYRNSICEIGLAIVENGEIKDVKSWLIKPPGNKYDDFNIYIHGITPDDTKDSPLFSEGWREVVPYIEGKVVVAHNTAFDMYALRDAFTAFDVPFPSFVHFCSCQLARKTLEGYYSYALDNVCQELGINLDGHHRAGIDAEACANVFLACIQKAEVESFAELQGKFHFRCGRFSDNYFRPQRAVRDYSKKKKINVSEIVGDPNKIDEGSYIYEKEVCFTGKCMYGVRKELLQMVADIGGIPANSVTSSTNILVVGQQDYRVVGQTGMSSKQKKAMALRDKGQDIEILSEADFLSMMGI